MGAPAPEKEVEDFLRKGILVEAYAGFVYASCGNILLYVLLTTGHPPISAVLVTIVLML